jgi:hypothetical protein
VNPGEQFIQLARRRDPEQGVHRLIANVLVAVRNPHGHARQATRGETVRIPVECQFHLAVDEVDELVLRWVNMRRHEGAGFTDNSDGTGVNSPQKRRRWLVRSSRNGCHLRKSGSKLILGIAVPIQPVGH